MSAPADLVTQAFLAQALAGIVIEPWMPALFPALAASASRAVRRYCHRLFTRGTFDELYTLDAPPSRTIILDQLPLLTVSRCATSPTQVLSVNNTDTATNQRALVSIATTGDTYTGLVATGLSLTRVHSAATTTVPLAFADYPTLQALATAIGLTAGGWTATVTQGFELWASADLRPIQGAFPALGVQAAGLVIHVEDLAFLPDARLGTLTLGSSSLQTWDAPWLWPMFPLDGDVVQSFGGREGVRVVYEAGFDEVPADVQQATVEVAKSELLLLKADPTLSGETADKYSYTAFDPMKWLVIPYSAQQLLSPWVNRRA